MRLVFSDRRDCQDFQSSVREIPTDYRKRSRNLPDDELNITDSITEVEVSKSLISSFKRVFYNDYQRQSDDPNQSILCDTVSDFTDYSYVSAVFVTTEIRLRLIDAETSTFMFKKKPEKCHLKSQTKFTELKNNQNNIVYLSRQLHEYFDGINIVNGVPTFTLDYVSHNPNVVAFVCENGVTLKAYETTVSIKFLTEQDKTVLSPYFRDHRDVSTSCIEFSLYFENPEAFKEYATFKADDTRSKWASLLGPEGMLDDEELY